LTSFFITSIFFTKIIIATNYQIEEFQLSKSRLRLDEERTVMLSKQTKD